MIGIIIAGWLVSGIAGAVLITIWWTDELPLTTDELPLLVLGTIFLGPIHLVTGLMCMVSLAVKKIGGGRRRGRRVILGQWGK